MEGYIFDYRLGYIRDGCELTGFDVLGNDDAPDGRIVTLGGYTTPETAKNRLSYPGSAAGTVFHRCQTHNDYYSFCFANNTERLCWGRRRGTIAGG